jgi:hypothetical protein
LAIVLSVLRLQLLITLCYIQTFEKGHTIQWPKEEGHTLQWPKEEGHTIQWPKEKGQKDKQL